jgi:hypothetical protein
VPAALIRDELEQISEKQAELQKLIESQSHEVRPVLIHPTMALRYRKAVTGLRKSLKSGQTGEAKEHVRALIEKIVLTPKKESKELSSDLYGDLAGILRIATKGIAMKNMTHLTKRPKKMLPMATSILSRLSRW